jgi:hypothetical protein
MIKLSLSSLAVAVGGLALSLTAGAGVASADPDLDPIVNTTCSYPQVMSALNAQDPGAAAQFNASPANESLIAFFPRLAAESTPADGPDASEHARG